MGKRFEELDSLRGIAALIVLLSHFLQVFSVIEKEVIWGYMFFKRYCIIYPFYICR